VIGLTHPVIAIEGFSGPFDLLLRLIERRELDILTISLAEVTEQYLQLLTEASVRDPEHLSAFLVVAAKLLLIKSSLLLPARTRPPIAVENELDPTDLTDRLRRYQRYRIVAEQLGSRHDAGLRSYARPPTRYRPDPKHSAPKLPASLLAVAYRAVLARPHPEVVRELAGDPRQTLADALAVVQEALERLDSVQFDRLVGVDAPRQRYVATFLAILELIRLGLATANQSVEFGEITVERASPSRAIPTVF